MSGPGGIGPPPASTPPAATPASAAAPPSGQGSGPTMGSLEEWINQQDPSGQLWKTFQVSFANWLHTQSQSYLTISPDDE